MFRAGWIAPLAVLAIALAVLLSDAGGAASRLRGALFDAYQRQSPAAQGSADVRVLVPDPASLKRYGPWPWPHAVLVRLTTEAKAAGASMMVFAFALDRPDPASPQNLLAELPPGPQNDAARATLSAMPSPDTDFASALRAMPSVVGITLDPAQPGAAPLIKAHFIYLGPKAPFAHAPLAHDAAPSLAELESAAAGTGALNLILDADGTLRRMPLLFRLGAAIVPSLDAEALRLSLGETTLTVKGDEGDLGAYGDRPGIAAMVSRKGDLPTAPDGSFWIAFSKSARDVAVSALDGAAPPSLGDAILFLGAPGAMVKTPLGYRDVAHIQARAMENILDASMLRRPVSALEAEAVWLLLFGLGTIFLSQRFGIFAASLLTAGGIAGAGLISWHLYLANHALFDAATPGAGLLLVFACGVGLRMRRVMRARSALRLAFADSLPRAVIDKIARRPFLLKLDGENRTITYLACGVRGFAGLAASFRNDPAAFT
ncbi:MAG TPA: CHASE2 domain-containing protein, partial [Rhizomicrobium sp.]